MGKSISGPRSNPQTSLPSDQVRKQFRPGRPKTLAREGLLGKADPARSYGNRQQYSCGRYESQD